jgi:hypothetical protein
LHELSILRYRTIGYGSVLQRDLQNIEQGGTRVMSLNATTGVSVSTDAYASYATSTASTEVKAETAAKTQEEVGATYEKSSDSSTKATYSVNKMSAEDRAALVEQLKADQEAREQSLLNIVSQTLNKQAGIFSFATSDSDDDSIWKMIASGNFTVDAATKAQAQEDISEDGYWGVKQTAQRLFDFASALAGDDVDNMEKMQAAMMKGYEQATGAWGKELPSISKDTIDAANKLFEDYYKNSTES